MVMLPTWCAAQREPHPPLGVQPRAELSGQYCIAVPHGCSVMAETPGGEELPTWSWGPPAEMGQHVTICCLKLLIGEICLITEVCAPHFHFKVSWQYKELCFL